MDLYKYRKKRFKVARLVYEAFYGKTDLCITYKDGDPSNCLVHNLRARSREQINQLGPLSRNENGNAKLTLNDARRIKHREKGTQKEIALRYGVSQTIISSIRRNKAWVDI